MGRGTVYNNITSPEKIALINPKNIDLLEGFTDYLISVDRSKTTISQYKSDLMIFFCWNIDNNDNKFFIELNKRDIAKFQKHALTEWEWSTNRLNRMKSTLSSISNYVENILDDEYEGYRSIVRKIESPVNKPKLEKTIITDKEVDDILDRLIKDKKYQCACAFALAAFGGARKSELLRYKMYYFNSSNIMKSAALYATPETITTKGRGSSGTQLTKYTLLDFKKYYDIWIEERERLGLMDNEYLFVKNDGSTMTTHGMQYFAELITEYLGRPFYWHSLRHQLCSRLFRLNLPSYVIQEYFGWASAEMLQIYNDNKASDSFGNYFTNEGIKGGATKEFAV